MVEVTEFDLVGVIPREGRVSIEASAGTGKTYALAALATRYVAESDVTIDQILVVTFGRLAARELREKIRERISYTVRALSGQIPFKEGDEVSEHLARFDSGLHRKRLEQALLNFDTSTITTIHSFAQQIRSTLGSFARLDLDAVLQDDTDEIVNEVVTDVLSVDVLRQLDSAVVHLGLKPTVRSTLVKLAKIALNNPGITVLPELRDGESEVVNDALREALAKRALLDKILEEVARRRRQRGTLSYDDVLTQLRDALSESPHAIDLLRRRFPVVLVDEFQDTDQVQWEVFERLFGSRGNGTRLIVVGDPKQAIYGFRGANVYSYLGATLMNDVEHHRLSVNYRSDGALVTGLERLLRGVTLGHSEIAFHRVRPSEEHRLRRLVSSADVALPGLSIRTALGADLSRKSGGLIAADAAREAIAIDLSCCVDNLLEDARIPQDGGAQPRRVRPNDIAVLVSRNAEAVTMQQALRNRGIAAVIRQGLSVLDTEAESQWRLLMNALALPSDPDRARRVALGWFFAHDARSIAGANDDALREVQETLLRWSEALNRHGIADFCSMVWAESNVMCNVLGLYHGDRNMTDLNQIVGLLHRGDLSRHPTPDGVLRVLDQLREIHRDDLEEDLLSQQVESEAMAVQILTIHKSKGLQFPIVCVPSMWHAVARGDFYQDFERNERILAVDRSSRWPSSRDYESRQRLTLKDAVGENLRLLYVALTRAEHQTIVWWTRVKDNQNSGLARLLFAKDGARVDSEDVEVAKFEIPPDDEVVTELRRRLVAGDRADDLTVTEIGTDWPTGSRWIDQEVCAGVDELMVAKLTRVLSGAHRRWSFSAMRPAGRAIFLGPGMRLDLADESFGDSGANDEPVEMSAYHPLDVSDSNQSDLALGTLTGGTEFGTLVHKVLQEVDFTTDDLDGALAEAIDRQMRWRGLTVDRAQLVRGLNLVIGTPLGRLFADRCLRDFGRADRLDEIGFEIRLGRRSRYANIRDIGAVLADHLSEGDPMKPWAVRVREGLIDEELAGHLTGSIDLVLRVNDFDRDGAQPRFVLADYKTNVLSDTARPPMSVDYRPTLLPKAMAEHHYPLQATLYAVALHRYLRWRVLEYDPEIHFGGVAYLFLRGMQGASNPREASSPFGVFSWEFSAALLGDLTDLLDGTLDLA